MAQRQYSSIRNDYEITFDANSQIEEAQDEGKIQVAVYNFKKVRPRTRPMPRRVLLLYVCMKLVRPAPPLLY